MAIILLFVLFVGALLVMLAITGVYIIGAACVECVVWAVANPGEVVKAVLTLLLVANAVYMPLIMEMLNTIAENVTLKKKSKILKRDIIACIAFIISAIVMAICSPDVYFPAAMGFDLALFLICIADNAWHNRSYLVQTIKRVFD